MLAAAAARRLRGVAHNDEAVSCFNRCIFGTMILPGVAPIARADTFTYLLDNNTLADANGGPSLVSYAARSATDTHLGRSRG
jgi:hypothetical protein